MSLCTDMYSFHLSSEKFQFETKTTVENRNQNAEFRAQFQGTHLQIFLYFRFREHCGRQGRKVVKP